MYYAFAMVRWIAIVTFWILLISYPELFNTVFTSAVFITIWLLAFTAPNHFLFTNRVRKSLEKVFHTRYGAYIKHLSQRRSM